MRLSFHCFAQGYWRLEGMLVHTSFLQVAQICGSKTPGSYDLSVYA